MKRKLHLSMVCIIVAVSMLFAACGGKTPETEDSTAETTGNTKSTISDGRYNPPITLTACRLVGPHVKYAEGENIENNIWTRAYEEKLGIKLKYTFTSPDFQTFDVKVNMAIASDSLPDVMPIYTTLFFRARDTGRLADLTKVIDRYAIQPIKDAMAPDGIAYKTSSKDGKIYAICGTGEPYMGTHLLWMRADWLKNLGLQPPKTMDDVINIAKAFANNDPDRDGEKDTFGLALNKDLHELEGFFAGYHAYDMWIEKDGRLAWGSIQPEMKTALTKLAELYKAGAIDEEFVLKTGEDMKQDYGAEAQGMVFGPVHLPDGAINQSVKSNPNAQWEPYLIPSCDDKPALGGVGTRVRDFVAVNTKCKYPEALIKLANIWPELFLGEAPENRAYHDKDGIDTFWYPFIGAFGQPKDYNILCHDKVVQAINTGDTSKLNGEQLGYYERTKLWMDKKNPDGWGMYKIYGPGGVLELMREVRDKKLYLGDKGWGPETPTWMEKGPNLSYKKYEMFTNIIMGQVDVEQGFKDWVDYFNNNGGAKATEEINEWYKTAGKTFFY